MKNTENEFSGLIRLVEQKDLVLEKETCTCGKQTVKETAYQLGFSTTANFCRYFKRATGIYPQAYKEKLRMEN